MQFVDKLKSVWQGIGQKVQAAKEKKTDKTEKKAPEGSTFRMICMWAFKLRSVILSIPVAFVAVLLAIDNMFSLPETVSLCLPSTDAQGMVIELVTIGKGLACFGPLLITAACLAMVFCSRRVAYPWLISVFSLVLPLFIQFASVFPG